MADTSRPRGYRFGERRRSGLFGSMPPALAGIAAVALAAAWLTISGYAPIEVGFAALAVCAWLWFGRLRGRPVHEILPALILWRSRRSRNQWFRPVGLLSGSASEAVVELPPAMAGLALYEMAVSWLTPGVDVSIGVVHDEPAATVTAVLKVSGDGQFALVDAGTQEIRIDEWGTAIAGFAREQSPVARITFHDWTAPLPIRDSVAQLESRWATEPAHPARPGYLDLLRDTSASIVDHEVLVEVTVDLARPRTGRQQRLTTGLRTVAEQCRLFASRLDAAGLRVDAVLSADDIVTATRVRSDPSVVEQLATLRRTSSTATAVTRPAFGPMHVDDRLTDAVVDSSLHRSWWFSRWPRREVAAAWLDGLVFEASCTRSLTTVFEPVAPSRSDGDVDRERTQREANIETRRRKGFIVRRIDEKAVAEVESREAELAAGYVECMYTGLLTLTASTADELDSKSADLEQAAANSGIELQLLVGRQAAGWVSSLPLGRNVARRIGDR